MTARLFIGKRDFDAIIFDMDGVVTDTARVHFAAWKRLFDELLAGTLGPGVDTRPFTEDDYHKLVDGRSRLDGIVAFLADRGAQLEPGSPTDDPGDASVWALANRKNDLFLDALAAEPAEALASSVDVARAAKGSGIDIALVTASRNRDAVLESAGLGSLFEVVVDGVAAADLGLAGRPDPAMFLEAARRLGVEPARAVVFEDALPGVVAARRGGFGLVIGVDRSGERTEEFIRHGADDVVTDLAEVRAGDADLRTFHPRGRGPPRGPVHPRQRRLRHPGGGTGGDGRRCPLSGHLCRRPVQPPHVDRRRRRAGAREHGEPAQLASAHLSARRRRLAGR
jgi:alpha,alpha-trehalase